MRYGAVIVMGVAVVACAGAPAANAATQTLVFDDVAKLHFVDAPPAGPSVGDVEQATGKLRDSSGRFVGSVRDRCVFTKQLANDMLERCSATAKTNDGSATLAGAGRLNSMNPPWRVIGRSGAYKGLRGKQVFSTDIALDPGLPVADGRIFSVAVIRLSTNRRLHAGVVPRPAANAAFIRRVRSACRAAQAQADKLPPFPFSSFDPFHPDPSVLPQVGQFFDAPAQRALPRGLLRKLTALGRPPASRGAWTRALTARRVLFANEAAQIKDALADDGPAFVKTVYQQSRDFNEFVFRSAIFSDPPCTIG